MFLWLAKLSSAHPSCKNNTNNGYTSTSAGNIFIKTNPVVIPFCTKLDARILNWYVDACILNWYVEADHNRVGFDEDITCAGGDIPIVGIVFSRGAMGTFPKFLVREGN